MNTGIEETRKEIDKIDNEIVRLFEKRMEASCEIARYKKENGLAVRDPERERLLVNRLVESVHNPEFERYLRMLYTTLLSVSRSYQNQKILEPTRLNQEIARAIAVPPRPFPAKARVACQGIEGAYSQLACEKMFEFPEILYFRGFEGVFRAVSEGLCDFGVLPLENSTAGSVNRVYGLMNQFHFYIVKSARLHIDHTLIAKRGVRIEDIREVVSHEQALAQCSRYLETLGDVHTSPCLNTAIAAQTVSSSSRNDMAAIASEATAELYGLQVLQRNIQNSENNHTRFICISKNLEIYPGADKTSLVINVPHRPGALHDLISRFQALGLNLSKLESRPVPGSDFEFMFYFDIDASIYAPELARLLCELEQDVGAFQYLGSYIEMP